MTAADTALIARLHAELQAEQPAIAALRRDLHAHPELCFEEVRTADVVARQLAQWGIEVHTGLGKTGVVGVIRGAAPGADAARSVGLRADMDALPMTERNTFAHASQHVGRMHACGHDGHTAMLLAAAQHLAARRDTLGGTLYLVFQPAEEGGGGARQMIQDGLFARYPMQAIFGMHNWPGLAAGDFAVADGAMMASSNEFRIELVGKGGHAALPHTAVDPIPAACQLVQTLQTVISRNKRPVEAGVLSVTKIHAGEALNVIPDRCVLEGTVRTFTTELLDLIEARMRTLAEHTAAAHGMTATMTFHRNYPPTVNHAREAQFVRRVMQEVAGVAHTHAFEPTMGAEDFSFFLQQQPGAYFVIGNGDGAHRAPYSLGVGLSVDHADLASLGPCTLHNPHYDFNDEVIARGAALWVRIAQRWLAGEGG